MRSPAPFMKKLLVLSMVSCLGPGCTSIGKLDPADGPPSQTESYFIFGLRPDHFRIALFSGSIENGVFKQSFLSQVPVFYGGPSDGYAMGKAKPGDVLAVTVVRTGSTSHSDFSPCGAQTTLVFKVPGPGSIAYLGDVAFATSGGKLLWQFKQNAVAARQYLTSKAPPLAERLVLHPPELLPTAAKCSR